MLTTGGTGPARRDVTPEATLAIAHKVMPGFGEQMRQISLNFVPTAILSRQVAVIRGKHTGDQPSGTAQSIRKRWKGCVTWRASRACTGSLQRFPTALTLLAALTSKPTTRCARHSGRKRHSIGADNVRLEVERLDQLFHNVENAGLEGRKTTKVDFLLNCPASPI